MALTGTLKDFGIAEILQLIGQQAKSGVLHLTSREDEIHVLIADGCVVSAEYAGRKQKERLGAMLVRAELITRDQLDAALAAQSRTLRRLGDVLVDMQLVSKGDLKEMTALQTTETVYRLFGWKSGTYEFEPGAVEWDPSTVTPLRAESVLMEGFRQVDEWPMVRRRISPGMTFARTGPLPDGGGAGPEGELAGIGPGERRVHALAEPGRTVERIVDLSRLGEFETYKALLALANLGLLQPVPAARLSAAAGVGAYARGWRQRLRRGATRAAATLALAAALAGVGWVANERRLRAGARGGQGLQDGGARRFLARYQLSRLGGALEVWRLEHGEYPDRLSALVEAGLVEAGDLRYPYPEDYHYRRRTEGGYVLLPPLP
jgi:Domain of unknown function (DUF4388)